MKTYIKYLLFLISTAILIPSSFGVDYPKTRAEKKADKLGSVFDGDGLIFRPRKIKNNSTQNSIGNVNKYLWQAAIETVSSNPIISVDIKTGAIITDWYTPDKQQTISLKININIKDTVISPSAIEVVVFQQSFQNGKWIKDSNNVELASSIENKILTRARNLFIADNKHKE